LSDSDAYKWKCFEENLTSLESITIPRWLKSQDKMPVQIHGLPDTSDKAYAAVVCAKVGTSSMFISSKSKVNPKKNRKTIPKVS